MQTNKDLFDLIKETYPLNPSPTFITTTESKLRQTARRLNRKQQLRQFSYTASGLALLIVAISCFIVLDVKEIMINQLNSSGEVNQAFSINEQEPIILIYHTHNQESFLPETHASVPEKAIHESKNITLVGDKLNTALRERNVSAIQDKSDVMQTLKQRGLSFAQSYEVSREMVNHTLEKHASIRFAFDIHRDANRRKATTVHLNGDDFGRIGFVVSASSKNYEDNKKFAEYLHRKFEENYSGLSRGVIVKSKSDSNDQSTYNQELINNSLLLEIGGVDNTLDENYRTVEVLADIIAEYVRNN